MRKKTVSSKSLQELRVEGNNIKYMAEYISITDKLVSVEKDEIFPQLVKLMKVCKKMDMSLPEKYSQYYSKTKIQLSSQIKMLEKSIIMSQINNENYSHLEEKINGISRRLGLSTTM